MLEQERARLLIEQAEALGEPPEDPLMFFSVLNGFGRLGECWSKLVFWA
jgi:hypothetical protein